MNQPFSILDDHQLQKLISQGNQQAFRVLFNRYWERLYCYAYRIYEDEDICEDIVQEIFIRLWERQDESKILNLEGYLFRSIKYAIANRIRDLKFKKVHEEVLGSIIIQDSPQRKMEYQEFEEYTLTLIENLPDRCGEIFKLSRFENLSNQQISEKLNISIRTVETQISNALRILRKNLPDSRVSVIISLLFLNC